MQELISFEEEHLKKNIADELWTIYICEFALIFCEKWTFFFRWYALERRLKQTSQDSSFQSWLFYSLFS